MAKQKKKLSIVSNDVSEHKAYANKNFNSHHVNYLSPKTYPQKQFIESYDKGIPIIAQTGSAGSGKTFVALHCALTDVFDPKTPYTQVMIVRSAVPTRDIGFLPGDQSEKEEVFETPYVSLCDEIMCFKSRNYENLKAKNIIDFKTTSYMRGQTFDNTIIIVDEAQSMTYHELSTITTRLGKNARLVICGDAKQNDLIKSRNDKSGLKSFMDVLSKMSGESVDVINYLPHDIVRSGVVREFLIAEEDAGLL